MKKSLIRLLLVLLALSSCAQARPVILEPGTEVLIRVVDRIKSNKVKKGQVLSFVVDAPVRDAHGFVAIDAGAPAYGTVTTATRAGMFGKRGSLAITIDRAVAWNGSDVPLVSHASDKGDNNTAVVTTAALFISAPAIFFRGSNAVIESGTILRAQVAARTYLEDGPYAAPVPDRPSGRRTRPRR